MFKKLIYFFGCVCLVTNAIANADSVKATVSEYKYVAPTTIFGIYDPLNVQMQNKKFVFSAYGDLYSASNCFSASFIQNFFGSGFITDQMKGDASAKLSDNNTIGVDLGAGLWMMAAMKNKPNTYFIGGIDYNFQESSEFTADLFHLVFYGNYDLQDYTAVMSGSKFSLTNVMEYKIGILEHFNDDFNTYKLGATIGLVQGISGLDIKAKTATLYTAEDGRYLDLDYDFSIKTSGNNKPSLTNFAGIGFSADIFGQIYLKGPEITINAMANDLGLVSWNQEPTKIFADSTLFFEGIETDNLFSATNEATEGNTDSLLQILGVTEEEDVFTQALPSRINISASKLFGNDYHFTLGGQYMLNTPYKPLVFMQVAKAFAPIKMSVGINAHTGGYGQFNAGLDISKSFGSYIDLRLGSNSLLGLIAPDAFTGIGGYGTLVVRL
jgi:hypothetical protein